MEVIIIMIVYHGTLEENAKSIIKDGRIKSDVERVYISNGIETTNGFVYVSQEISRVMQSALSAANTKNHWPSAINIAIFKGDVPLDDMVIDEDEVKSESAWKSMEEKLKLVIDAESSLKYIKTAAVPRDLIIKKDITHYCLINGADAGQLRNKDESYIEETINWIEL